MHKLYTLGCSLLLLSQIAAQSVLKVESGTDLFIRSGTSLYAGGLVLQPASDYSIGNNELIAGSSISHYSNNSYATRVLSWQQLAPAFSGTIRYYYTDDVLNGIPESNLALNVYNGSYWQYLPTVSSDLTENYVETGSVSSLPLVEFALSDELSTLPLLWGGVQALRNNGTVQINFSTIHEHQVSHFVIERSFDSRNWLPVSNEIAARNLPTEQSYNYIDQQAPSSRLYYRIRQQDSNGIVRYSVIVTVAALGQQHSLLVFPNPTTERFRLLNIDPLLIRQVYLYNLSGQQLLSWSRTSNNWYTVNSLAAGRYLIRVELTSGETQQLSFIKK
jgi:hypothetical protein